MSNQIRFFLALFLCFTFLVSCTGCAYAAEDASPIYTFAIVSLGNSLVANCNAETRANCDEIYISSIYLQRVNSNGSTIYSSTMITPPGTVATGTDSFFASCDCSAYASVGNYYRVKVTFSADGEAKTATSNIVYYN